MKNKLKKPISPEKLWLHILRLTGFALLLSILLFLFALLTVGLPPALTRRITEQAQEAGIPLQIHSIRLSTHRGWVLNEFRLYSTSPDDLQPILSAKKMYVIFRPVNWKKPFEDGWHVKLYVRDLGVSMGRPWETVLSAHHPFRTVSKMKASLTASRRHLAVESADLRWGGIRIAARGTALFSDTESSAQAGTDFRRRAAKAAEALSRIKCEQPPQIDITFNYNEALPQETSAAVSLSAGGIPWRDRVYRRLTGEMDYRDSTLTVSSLRLSYTDREQLRLHGFVHLASSNAQISVENTLSVSELFNLLPEEALSAIAQTGIKLYGRLDFTASAGPAPYEQLAEKVDVQIGTAQLRHRNITLDPLSFRLTREGSRLAVQDIRTSANGGAVAGRFEADLNSTNWTAEVQAQCNPEPFCALIDADLHEFISRFLFSGEQPEINLSVSYDAAADLVTAKGTLSGENFTCGGIPVGRFDTFMIYSNQVLHLTPLHILRDHEKFDGSVQVDFASGLGFFNVTNSFPPADIARVLAPDERTVLEDIRFDGPVYAAGHGQIDYRNWTNHNFKGIFRTENIGMGKVQASLFIADVQGLGSQLIFTNVSARLYGGQAAGSGEFDLLLEDGTAPYRISAAISGLDLEELLRQTSTGDYNRMRGQLSAVFGITADAKTGFWKSVEGGGKVEIKEGRLADVPLFGGFSRLTQSVFPGFSLFSLTTFSADYELRAGAVWSENARLGGTLVSARGRGSYSPEKGLDFTVTAEPLRQTSGEDDERGRLQRLAAGALREGTAPFLRLLEFRLTGPLENPDWNFSNLPRELRGLPKDVSDLLLRSKDK